MSSDAADPTVRVPAEWDELELTVRRLLDQCDGWRKRAAAAERRIEELRSALRSYSEGEIDPMELNERVQRLERENRVLRERLDAARGGVDRIIGRLQFMEEAG